MIKLPHSLGCRFSTEQYQYLKSLSSKTPALLLRELLAEHMKNVGANNEED